MGCIDKYLKIDQTQKELAPQDKLVTVLKARTRVKGSDNAIYDMHIHSTVSEEKDYNLPTPEKYIDRAYEMAVANNCKVRISITDHQSIMGSVMAMNYLKQHPEYADRVEIVQGIEINTSLDEVNNKLSNKIRFGGCHILGYNYNVEDPELNAYSRLYYAKSKYSNYMGLKLIAARNYMKGKYHCEISFVELEKIYNRIIEELDKVEKKSNVEYDNFVSDKLAYILERKFKNKSFNHGKLKSGLAGKMFVNEKKSNSVKKMHGKCRLRLTETCRMIKNAGGTVVVAHPCNIYSSKDTKISKEELNILLKTMKTVTNNSIDGLEVFNNPQLMHYKVDWYIDAAKNNGLFVTCGSDCHGPKKASGKEYDDFIRVVPHVFMKQLTLVKNEDLYSTVPTYVTALPIWDYLKKGSFTGEKSGFEIVNNNFGKLERDEITVISNIASDEKNHKNLTSRNLKDIVTGKQQ